VSRRLTPLEGAPTSPPTPQPSASPTPEPTAQPITTTPTSPPTSQPSASPTPEPTGQPVTAAPTSPPTSQPSASPTPEPTGQPITTTPTSPPTSQPVQTVFKHVCVKNEPLRATICAEGATVGGACANEGLKDECGKGGKFCWWAECDDSGSPPPPAPTPPGPTPPSPAPTTPPGPGACEPQGVSCSDVSVNCCNGCSGGKPSLRICL
jgi:hypothetical protein